ncbi:MAG: NAD(P)/FAD-dependent oxidoreductase [Gammaproteobacteria bacterium]|nr:NAD(P)/FAD-dependent oxidoreductase [Gammaproteobacteria bacterium]
MEQFDVIIVGAGAAGLMCGIEAGKRGRNVLILDKSNKVGKKILMSGGGRCNFTNLDVRPEKFISHNPHFCKSALSRYTQWDFIALVERHHIAYFEKTLGQLFCQEKAHLIVDMLLRECDEASVAIRVKQNIDAIEKKGDQFILQIEGKYLACKSLVVASGGLSIPTLGASPFGYQLAAQFGLNVYPTRAGLVPLTLHVEDKQRLEALTGIAVETSITCNGQSFRENILFTHRGLSGPAILQISSYWHPGDELVITIAPEVMLYDELVQAQKDTPDKQLKTILEPQFAKRGLAAFYPVADLETPLKQLHHKQLLAAAQVLQNWRIKPNATEGYRTAEVTLGGVDCNDISSQTFASRKIPGLFFIGEVLDVTGWLGGYNFQWAWSSGWAAGQCV